MINNNEFNRTNVQDYIDKILEALKKQDSSTLNEEVFVSLMDIFCTFEPVGIGGSRIIFIDPINNNYVWKIAFNRYGVEGNIDEYNTYKNCPEAYKKYLGECTDIFAGGKILKMKFYEQIDEEAFAIYSDEVNDMLKLFKFVHYLDEPYYHSFGLDDFGNLVLIDYGETEHIEFKNIKTQKYFNESHI